MSKVAIDHVAFVVSNLEVALSRLGERSSGAGAIEEFPAEGTRECYVGEPGTIGRLLLIQPIGAGPYTDALERRGPGLHHVALGVLDIDAFLAEVVDGSGWYVHPRSFCTAAQSGTVWLARPGVKGLVELFEVTELPDVSGVLDFVAIAGLDHRPELARIFGDSLEVRPGSSSGVGIDGQFVSSLERGP